MKAQQSDTAVIRSNKSRINPALSRKAFLAMMNYTG